MVRPAVSPFALACAVAAFLAAAACSDSSSTTSTTGQYPTLLTVDPSLFRGTLQCGAPGLERYVASVTDVSVDAASFAATSLPTPCQSPVSFGDTVVAIYHRYTAVIDGYDRNDIAPEEPGQRQMFDADENPVSPIWTTTCGEVPVFVDTDADADADEDAASDAGVDADVANGFVFTPYIQLRAPTYTIGQVEVVMHGCLPLVASPAPDASAPDASAPDASAPDASAPDASAPDASVPDASVPEDSSAFAARAEETIPPIRTRFDSLDQAKLGRNPPPHHPGDGEGPGR
jgi:hypothetical protein